GCPAALTGRSANTIEVGLTPDNVRLWPCKLAPCAFMTNSDGTMSTLTDDLPGADALGPAVVGVWARAITGIQSKPPMDSARMNLFIAQSPSDKLLHPRRAERRLRGTRRNRRGSSPCRPHTAGPLCRTGRPRWSDWVGASNEERGRDSRGESEPSNTCSGHLRSLPGQVPGPARVSSTRRFWARPCGVSFEATGSASPRP